MLSRPPEFAAFAVVTTLKFAMKLKVVPSLQVDRGFPLRSVTLLTAATLTSLAEQFSFCLFTWLYSSCKQVCANAVWASPKARPPAKRVRRRNLPRQLGNVSV